MKMEYIDDNNFVIYLNKYYINDINLEDKKNIEEYFKKVFATLKNNYNVNMYGYYDVRVYPNKQYGLIIDVYKLSSDYYKLYGNKVDMKIMIESNNIFLYEIDDYFIIDKFKNKIKNIYYQDNKYYLDLDDNINERDYNYLLENSKIIYNDRTDEILSLCSIIS